MYFYEVGYTTWEECPITTLWHEKEFSQDEFNQLILDCYAEADKINKKKHDEWYTVWSEEERKKGESEMYIQHMQYKPRVSDMNRITLGILINNHGFHHMNISASFIPSDNYDIIPDEDGQMRGGDDHTGIIKMIRERISVIEPRDNKINDILKDGN